MLVIISPAKKLDFDTQPQIDEYTQPDCLDDATILIGVLRKYSVNDIAKLMHLSPALAKLNHERYLSWHMPFSPRNAKQALLTFKGDVYAGMNVESFSEDDLSWTQDHLRILSGLYGLLRPLDLMQPYRLEMGTKLKSPRGTDLYAFWGNHITEKLNQQLEASDSHVLINLASNEYYKAVKPKEIKTKIITPVFKENKDGQYKVIGIHAKKARGMMTAWIMKNRLVSPEGIKDFTDAGYQFNPSLSNDANWVFTRD